MEDMSSSNMMGASGSTLDSLVTGLLVLLIKLLLIALVVLLIIAVFHWIKKNYLKNITVMQYVNQNPLVKAVVGITAAIIGLIFLIYVYNYLVIPSSSYRIGTANSMSSASMSGFSGTLGITGVLTFLIKILIYVFVITLIISVIAYLKKQIESSGIHLFQTSNTADKNPNSNQGNTTNTGKKTQDSANAKEQSPEPENN